MPPSHTEASLTQAPHPLGAGGGFLWGGLGKLDQGFDVTKEEVSVAGVVENCGGVEGEKERVVMVGGPGSSLFHDGDGAVEKHGSGDSSEGAEVLGLDDLDLAVEEGLAGLDFVGDGVPVVWGAAFENVGDEDLIAAESSGFEGLGEEFSGGSDEGLSLGIFFCSGSFADKEESCVGVSHAGDSLGSGESEGAGSAGLGFLG